MVVYRILLEFTENHTKCFVKKSYKKPFVKELTEYY